MPDDRHGHVSSGNAASSFRSSVVSWESRPLVIRPSALFQRSPTLSAICVGDLRSSMLASTVERMMFIRLNKHMVDDVRDFDAAKAKAKARVAKSAKQSATAQQERANMVVDVSL